MSRSLAAATLAVALSSLALAPASAADPTGCAAAFRYAVDHNPYPPLPSGGGGGEPGGGPMPGQPREYAAYDAAAAVAFAKCVA